MKTIMKRDGIKTITTHYIDGMFVGSHGGGGQFAGPIVQCGVNAFLATEKALQELPLTRSWGKTTVTLEPVGVANLITAGNANALFICLKLASLQSWQI
jgi:aldehyde dehydrogenase (NAD+)